MNNVRIAFVGLLSSILVAGALAQQQDRVPVITLGTSPASTAACPELESVLTGEYLRMPKSGRTWAGEMVLQMKSQVGCKFRATMVYGNTESQCYDRNGDIEGEILADGSLKGKGDIGPCEIEFIFKKGANGHKYAGGYTLEGNSKHPNFHLRVVLVQWAYLD